MCDKNNLTEIRVKVCFRRKPQVHCFELLKKLPVAQKKYALAGICFGSGFIFAPAFEKGNLASKLKSKMP